MRWRPFGVSPTYTDVATVSRTSGSALGLSAVYRAGSLIAGTIANLFDRGCGENVAEALRICRRCPVVAECIDEAEELVRRGDPPRDQVLGGVAWQSTGRPYVPKYAAKPPPKPPTVTVVVDGQAVEVSADQVALLRGLAQGRKIPSIAARLGRNEDTVKSWRHRLYRALGVNCAAQAVEVGRRVGLLATAPAGPGVDGLE